MDFHFTRAGWSTPARKQWQQRVSQRREGETKPENTLHKIHYAPVRMCYFGSSQQRNVLFVIRRAQRGEISSWQEISHFARNDPSPLPNFSAHSMAIIDLQIELQARCSPIADRTLIQVKRKGPINLLDKATEIF